MVQTPFQSHYIPNTQADQASMLATLGLDSIDDLFLDIPREFRNPPLDLPEPMSELEVQWELGALPRRIAPWPAAPRFWVPVLTTTSFRPSSKP